MLKNCMPYISETKYLNSKCGEIFCETIENFTLVCNFCRVKSFDLEDFILHISNVHLAELQGTPIATAGDDLIVQKEYIQESEPESGETGEHAVVKLNIIDSIIAKNENYKHKIDIEESISNQNHETPYEVLDVWHEEKLKSSSQEEENEQDSNIQHITKKSRTLRKKQLSCEHCGKIYVSRRHLNIHIKHKHSVSKEYKCQHCNEEFAIEGALISHIRQKHTEYKCDQCCKTYKSARSLQIHSLGHRDTKDFVCDFQGCGKAFVSARRLTVHKDVHTGVRNFVCELCGYRTRLRDSLIVHKRFHTGEKPFICQICNKSFASRSSLNEHKPIHSNERPYKCDVCEKTFSRPKSLYHHKHLHLEKKKFICKLCGGAFAQAAGLAAHMRNHKLENNTD